MLDETLILLNPWWREKKVPVELAPPYKRKALTKISSLIEKKQIIILTGLRRVGKSTLLYQTIEKILEEKNSEKKVFYFNFDKEVSELEEIFSSYSKLTNVDFKKEKIYVFLDEITKLQNWGRKIKLFYDSLPNIKFFISSSSSFSLEEEAIKNLGGRYFLLKIFPLSFAEFLELKGLDKFLREKNIYKKEIEEEFQKYLLRSFPEIVKFEEELLIKDFLKTTIFDKILKSDLTERFRRLNLSLLYSLINMIYKEPGIYLDYDSLSKNLKVSKKTLYKHLFYLEFSYLIRIVRNFRPSTFSSLRKLQRVYPYWWNLAIGFCENKDKLLENFVASIKDLRFYWREKDKEIDFLEVGDRELFAYEIKNKDLIQKREIKNINFFIKKYNPKRVYVISQKEESLGKNIISKSFIDFCLLEEQSLK